MRADLAALTPDSIAALSNWGLVKRASREEPPRLEEAPDGTVTGQFADGTLATLPPGKSLAQGSCTCGATTVCRHRVATALAYPRQKAAPWSPGEVSDEELERFLGKRVLEKARQSLARGLRAEVEAEDGCVRLPTCTVRFLVPRELALARCDCTQTGACEHVALAVWCFRKGEPRVEFGAVRARGAERLELQDLLLRRGIVDAGDLAEVFARARQQLAGMTWPLALVDTLEEQLTWYRTGSSRYRAGEAAFALLSLEARFKDLKELSASFVLGQDTPAETELEHVRLISLGCRHQSLYLADAAGQVLVLEKPAAGGVRWQSLATGQLVSKGVRRRANRSLTLRRERNRHAVMPLGQAWDSLPSSLTGTDSDGRATRLLRPLVLAEDFRVLSVSQVQVAYCPGEQQVLGFALLEDGTPLRLQRAFEAAAPGALDCLARHLEKAHQVSGFLQREMGELVLEPVALRTAEVVLVPDLEPEAPGWELPLLAPQPAADPLTVLLQRAWSLCEEAIHFGLDQLGAGHAERRAELAEALEQHGLLNLAGRFASWDWYGAALRTFLHLEGYSQPR